jgi:hypothetical protein
VNILRGFLTSIQKRRRKAGAGNAPAASIPPEAATNTAARASASQAVAPAASGAPAAPASPASAQPSMEGGIGAASPGERGESK